MIKKFRGLGVLFALCILALIPVVVADFIRWLTGSAKKAVVAGGTFLGDHKLAITLALMVLFTALLFGMIRKKSR